MSYKHVCAGIDTKNSNCPFKFLMDQKSYIIFTIMCIFFRPTLFRVFCILVDFSVTCNIINRSEIECTMMPQWQIGVKTSKFPFYV